jgi:hypothetical protein
MELNKFTQMLEALNKKYENNVYMLNRLELHLQNLPNMLEQEHKRYDERVSRFNELTLEQNNFHKVFLSKHQYYYMPYNNIYYEYDGKTYKVVKDDDIYHNLLSTITDEGKLIQWKHKTKQTIIKHIKERSLLKSTPETYTIQNVLGFLQTIFQTKMEAKYFLTVIGDCILKKNTENLLYFVSSTTKTLILLIDSICYITNGNSIMNNFITKYHDTHKLSLYRLININNNVNTFSYDIVKSTLNNIGLDLLCVASHYSERYTNADNYLKTKTDSTIQNYVLYFEQYSQEKIIDEFCAQCIETVTTDSNINWKNMHYIWKLYLTSINIPNMIYSSQLQNILSTKLENSNENGSIIFTNITSKYLPYVSSYLLFWEKYITITTENNVDDEYEIDELMTLYKHSEEGNYQITDVNMIKMICHYFSPHVEVIDNKYITNIKCNLWSKHDDINEYLKVYKSKYTIGADTELISIDDLYQGYKSYYKAKGTVDQKTYLVVSKQFFEKYLMNQLSNYIHFDKFITSDWILDI